MANYQQIGRSKGPSAQAQSYSYGLGNSLRDPMDRFSSPGPPRYSNPPQYEFGPPQHGPSDSQAFYNNILAQKHARPAQRSRLNPKYWSKRSWIIAAVSILVILIVIIIAAVEATKANAYPDYTDLNYTLKDTFSGPEFFSNFQYWDTYDPSDGFVHYDNPTDATVTYNTTFAGANSAVLRVDNKQNDATTGRHSARVSSINTYASGLFVFDILHFPTGCATWPAVWLTNQYSWPADGEIDVIEAVNQANRGNQMTLHTSDGCSMSVKRKMTGSATDTNCWNSTNNNAGCGVKGAVDTYGSDLNSAGGGVYAMELRQAGIRIWFWDRASVPADLSETNSSTVPQPQTWGEAIADFPSTDCNIGNHFKNLSIVANVDVCGTWAGSTTTYSKEFGCPGTCTTYAANTPSAFDDAYWEFKSFRVWQAS